MLFMGSLMAMACEHVGQDLRHHGQSFQGIAGPVALPRERKEGESVSLAVENEGESEKPLEVRLSCELPFATPALWNLPRSS
jgi:hypothetical protein